MSVDLDRIDDLVSIERGEIDRRIFSDEEIFEREMEQIFGRAWLFLCHESQLKKAGDFFEAPMGRDNVLVVRQKDGGLKGLLNTCMHRGNAVCRAEEGNTKVFMCTYHGWTYGLDGSLIGVPGPRAVLQEQPRSLASTASRKSRSSTPTRASSSPRWTRPRHRCPSSSARPDGSGIELIAARGDMEVVPGIQKFVINCNWKFTVDNLFDWYHPQITHMSAFNSGILPGANPEMIDPSETISADGRARLLTGTSCRSPAAAQSTR